MVSVQGTALAAFPLKLAAETQSPNWEPPSVNTLVMLGPSRQGHHEQALDPRSEHDFAFTVNGQEGH
jgi:hypothetical protein